MYGRARFPRTVPACRTRSIFHLHPWSQALSPQYETKHPTKTTRPPSTARHRRAPYFVEITARERLLLSLLLGNYYFQPWNELQVPFSTFVMHQSKHGVVPRFPTVFFGRSLFITPSLQYRIGFFSLLPFQGPFPRSVHLWRRRDFHGSGPSSFDDVFLGRDG